MCNRLLHCKAPQCGWCNTEQASSTQAAEQVHDLRSVSTQLSRDSSLTSSATLDTPMTPDLLLTDVRSRSNGLGIHLVTAPWIPQGIRLRRRRARRRKTSIERRCQTPHTDDGKGAIITLGCCAPRALCWANFRRGESLLVMGRIFDFRSGGSSSSYPRRITSLPLCRPHRSSRKTRVPQAISSWVPDMDRRCVRIRWRPSRR